MWQPSPPPSPAGGSPHGTPSLLSTREWWGARRGRYNRALLGAGVVAFVAYLAALAMRCADSPGVEVTVFTTAFQGVVYLLAMGVANVCYLLGPGVERLVPTSSRARYRRWAFAAGLGFSVALPFLVPLTILLAGCGERPLRAEIVGAYRLNRGTTIDSLLLRSDGVYLHVYASPEGGAVVDSGRWHYDPEDEEDRAISFFDFRVSGDLERLESGGRSTGAPFVGLFMAPAERRRDGAIAIIASHDLALEYRKVGGEPAPPASRSTEIVTPKR